MAILTRKYVQFNDLVIDNYDMLASADLSGGFKTATINYSFGHGSYASFKARQQFSIEQSLSMTLRLDTRKLTCDQRKFYKKYILLNIMKPGKLWAIEGEQLLWTNAFVKDFSETYALEKHVTHIDVDLVLYDGVWYKADSRKTFLQPYSLCNFGEFFDFRETDECFDCCVSCIPTNRPCPKCLADCEFLTAENSFCELKSDIAEAFYSQCGETYRIIYNCSAGERIWGEEKMLGNKLCKQGVCHTIIAGQFYSDTVVDSRDVTVTIIGSVRNPIITINGNSMQVIGEFDGRLTLTSNGEIFHQPDECCAALDVEVDINKLVIPEGNTFGFLVHSGMNQVLVETNNCCDMVCVFIKAGRLTI